MPDAPVRAQPRKRAGASIAEAQAAQAATARGALKMTEKE